MIGLAVEFWIFVRSIRALFADPKVKPLLYIVPVLLGGGTLFYHHIEGWSWIDSLYFCVITLATVGFGDFAPETRIGKLFTIFYLFLGIGTLLALINAVTARSLTGGPPVADRHPPTDDHQDHDEENRQTHDRCSSGISTPSR
jgi:hypothetical protein